MHSNTLIYNYKFPSVSVTIEPSIHIALLHYLFLTTTHFNDIFTHVTITIKVSGTNMKVRSVLKYKVQKKSSQLFFKTLI